MTTMTVIANVRPNTSVIDGTKTVVVVATAATGPSGSGGGGGGGTWGSITGTLSAQTDLAAALAALQPLDSDLTAIAALSTTSFGRSFLVLADAAAGRTALSLGTAATSASTDFQPLDSDLTAIAALTTTSFGRSFLALADAAAGRTLLGLGTAATQASSAFDTAGAAAAAQAASQPLDSDLTAIAALTTTSFGRGLLALADAAALRSSAGLGTAALSASTDFQPIDSDLTAIAALTTTSFGRSFLALADAAAGRTLLGLGGAALLAVGTTAGTVAAGDDSRILAALGVTPTAVKTTTYSAAAGDFVPCDTTSGGFTVTLPNAPADKTIVAIKHVIQGSTNVVTYACAGSDVINKTAGATSGTLTLLAQAVLLQYKASGAIWYVVSTDAPLAQLDLRFAAKTAAGGPYGSATAIPAITVNADGSLSFATNAIVLPKFGGLMAIGHSYTQKAGNLQTGASTGLDLWTNWTHRVAGALQIPVEEVFLWGKSGAYAGRATLGDGTTLQGSGIVMRHHHPNHWFATNGTTPSAAHSSSKGWPALYVFQYGFNDLNDVTTATGLAQAESAFKHGMRSITSRVRARALYASDDASIAYGGGHWSAKTDKNYMTKGKYEQTATNADSFTITLPSTLEGDSAGNVIVAACLLGNPNAVTTTTGNGTASTALAVAERHSFPQSGNFDIMVNGVQRTVTAGQGAGAGTFTLSAAATWTTGQEVTRPQGATVTWSGTASAASGTTVVGGVGTGSDGIFGSGVGGQFVHVVKRFALTTADAGKTIIGTLGSVATGEELDVDSWWIEENDPPQALYVNQPYGPFLGVGQTEARIAAINADMVSVAAEFTNNVQVVDLVATYNAQYRAICQAATSTSTTIHVTVNDTANTVIGIGSILRCDAEEMLVTGIVKNSPTDWQLTVTRNYTTAPDGQSTGGNVNHAINTPIYDVRAWCVDRVHPSDEGHVQIAALILNAIATTSQTAREIANSGGYVQKRQPKLIDGGFLWTQGGTRTTATNAGNNTPSQLNKMTAGRIYVPESAIITALSMETTVGYAATGVARLGIYADGNQAPGALVFDAGTIATTGVGVNSIACWIPLKPGWYWLGGVLQSTVSTGTLRVTTDVRSYQPLSSSTTPLGTAFSDNNGVLLTGVSGALPDPFGTPSGYQAGAAGTAAIMTVVAQYTIPIKD